MRSSSQPPVFCLTVGSSQARRVRFQAQAEALGLDFTFVEGPDAKATVAEEILALADQDKASRWLGRPLGLTEIACAEGHRCIYRRMLAEGCGFAIILEDDIELTAEFSAVAAGLAEEAAQGAMRAEVFFLGGREGFEHLPLWVSQRRARSVAGRHLLRPVVRSDRALQRTCSYGLTYEATRAILARHPLVETTADSWDYWLATSTIERAWILEPPVALHAAMPADSLIDLERCRIERDAQRQERTPAGLWRKTNRLFREPHRLIRGLALALGWRRFTRWLYALLSRVT